MLLECLVFCHFNKRILYIKIVCRLHDFLSARDDVFDTFYIISHLPFLFHVFYERASDVVFYFFVDAFVWKI